MMFLLITKIVLLLAALFMAVASIGANTDNLGGRCAVLSAMFALALVVILAFEIS